VGFVNRPLTRPNLKVLQRFHPVITKRNEHQPNSLQPRCVLRRYWRRGLNYNVQNRRCRGCAELPSTCQCTTPAGSMSAQGVSMARLWSACQYHVLCLRSVLVSTCISCVQISLVQLYAHENRRQDLLITFRLFLVWERSSGQGLRIRGKCNTFKAYYTFCTQKN
jgi:hypothetical protein